MKILLLMLATALSACVIPIQAIVNGRLGQAISNPFLAAWISFFGGAVSLTLIVLIANREIPPLSEAIDQPWYLYTGGLLGVVFVTTVLTVVPHLGTANVLAAAIVGQLTMSLIVDHFGLMGLPRHPVNFVKVIGVGLLVFGTLMISRSELFLKKNADEPAATNHRTTAPEGHG
ncbi:MAG: DMT family transporter [Planctomycetaceae bacterium]|nr:DMT family transporter [Planctomycetaceae bacterium]